MEESILNSTKKILGLDATYTAFDPDITTHINSSFTVLAQLGVGPEGGFSIVDSTTEWSEYPVPADQLHLIKTYIYLNVRILFDPPATSFHLTAAKEQLKEYEWRLNILREVDLVPHVEHYEPVPAGRRWIDVNRNPITGEPLDGA
jgi:hypothetical protein